MAELIFFLQLSISSKIGIPAFGFEINPSAWIFSKRYEFANLPLESREKVISELRAGIAAEFPIILFSEQELSLDHASSG